MTLQLHDAIRHIAEHRRNNPEATKEAVVQAVAAQLDLTKHRKVYACSDYAIRFSFASGQSFPNTVVGLRQLQQFDHKPFIVVVCRPESTEFLLANTTMLKKISHSSHKLRVDNIRGSLLGSDIIREYDGTANIPANFEQLFAYHQEFTWDENLQRLVEATNAIVGTGQRFDPSQQQRSVILAAPALAADLSTRRAYLDLKQELSDIVAERARVILHIASEHATNVNLRGNLIEQVITGGINEHKLGDMIRQIGEISLEVEIKTKLMNRASSPKAYNIDKALQTISHPNTLIVFCFVGIDLVRENVTSSTVSILDRTVLAATRIQFHWAGRNSRGVTQLTGNLNPLFSEDYIEQIDQEQACCFLNDLINR